MRDDGGMSNRAEPTIRRAARILVVDDEPGMAESVGLALDALGHEASVYVDPHLAIDAFADGFGHDLIITDCRMPGLRGEEVARWAKALRPGLPVILMSGSAIEPGGSAPVDGVLCKPFSIGELARVVDRALAASLPVN